MNTTIAGELLGLDAREQGMVDMLMLEADGTPNKSNFGANATLVSLATAQAAAMQHGMPLWRYVGGARPMCSP